MTKSNKITEKYSVMNHVYTSIRKYGDIRDVYIPHSSVFYIRSLIERDTGVRYTLKHVEEAMKAEGWTD